MTMAFLGASPSFDERGRGVRLVSLGRRAVLVLLAASLGLITVRAVADDVTVPVGLQAELVVKVASYDRNLAARAEGRVRFLVVSKPDDADSRRVAAQMVNALAPVTDVGGLPKEVSTHAYSGAAALAAACRAQRIAIVYFAPGLGDEVPAIAAALEEQSILSVAAMPSYVPHGIVLGIDVIEGRPKLLLNLSQARKQQVKLRPDVMQLMKVYP